MPEEVQHTISKALIKFSEEESGKQTLTDMYGIQGFGKGTDNDYALLKFILKSY
jgi:ABC-type phosphate/phosphonate transport system substrate-binding protein